MVSAIGSEKSVIRFAEAVIYLRLFVSKLVVLKWKEQRTKKKKKNRLDHNGIALNSMSLFVYYICIISNLKSFCIFSNAFDMKNLERASFDALEMLRRSHNKWKFHKEKVRTIFIVFFFFFL